MNKKPFESMNRAIDKAMTGLAGQQAQSDRTPLIWETLRDDPVRTVEYVRARTNKTGDDLAAEVVRYAHEMRRRYG